jgi:hypothetical protein
MSHTQSENAAVGVGFFSSAIIAAEITLQRSLILDKIRGGLAVLQDGLPVHLQFSVVLQGCGTEGAKGYVLLYAIVLWPVVYFGGSPDT